MRPQRYREGSQRSLFPCSPLAAPRTPPRSGDKMHSPLLYSLAAASAGAGGSSISWGAQASGASAQCWVMLQVQLCAGAAALHHAPGGGGGGGGPRALGGGGAEAGSLQRLLVLLIANISHTFLHPLLHPSSCPACTVRRHWESLGSSGPGLFGAWAPRHALGATTGR